MRRTAGLRREELAALAGISPGYYQRLEQGRVPQPSVSVLDALAIALRLSDEECRHLFALAGQVRPEAESEPLSNVARSMLAMLAPPTAAYVINRHSDVLAWNDTAAALFSHLVPGPRRPNNLEFVFTHPQARDLFLDWSDIAADSVAHLRAATGHRPGDTRLTELVRQLRAESGEFTRLWDARGLRHKVEGHKHLHHPLVGGMMLDYAVLAAPTAPGQRLVAYTAAPGSPSHYALLALGEAVGAREMSAV
ncbi:helix-turn-helix domain-containing protein [Streptomyces sp. NPDC058231]|uniref:helix-turn-helix domain-containing protein n=1 Tax=Streptomyces sp. NPDC058231 TaxID=3346392 RepID=UPI0036E807AE